MKLIASGNVQRYDGHLWISEGHPSTSFETDDYRHSAKSLYRTSLTELVVSNAYRIAHHAPRMLCAATEHIAYYKNG